MRNIKVDESKGIGIITPNKRIEVFIGQNIVYLTAPTFEKIYIKCSKDTEIIRHNID